MELEEKLSNFTAGINSTMFSPGCCNYGGWCDQLAAGMYRDFAKMIEVSGEWILKDERVVKGHPETLFKARGEFANVSTFDLNCREDYEFYILRLRHVLKVMRMAEMEPMWRVAVPCLSTFHSSNVKF